MCFEKTQWLQPQTRMRAAATVVLAKRTPCAWKENTVLSIITFASATVALENDRSATKLPHLNWKNFLVVCVLKKHSDYSLLQACVQGLTNLSMKYLNYPAKVMFKSSRVVATVVVGSLVQKKRYPIKDWIVVLLLLMGLATFMNAEIISKVPVLPPQNRKFQVCTRTMKNEQCSEGLQNSKDSLPLWIVQLENTSMNFSCNTIEVWAYIPSPRPFDSKNRGERNQ